MIFIQLPLASRREVGRFLPTGLPAPLGGGPSAAERGDPQGVAKRPGPGGGRTAAEAARRARDRELPCLCGLRTGMATGLPGMQKTLPWLWGKAPLPPGQHRGNRTRRRENAHRTRRPEAAAQVRMTQVRSPDLRPTGCRATAVVLKVTETAPCCFGSVRRGTRGPLSPASWPGPPQLVPARRSGPSARPGDGVCVSAEPTGNCGKEGGTRGHRSARHPQTRLCRRSVREHYVGLSRAPGRQGDRRTLCAEHPSPASRPRFRRRGAPRWGSSPWRGPPRTTSSKVRNTVQLPSGPPEL